MASTPASACSPTPRIPADRLAELQTQPDPVAQRRPRRPAAAPRHAADDRPEIARPRPRLFRRPAADHRRAPGPARPRRDAGDPEPGQRRRVSGDLAPLAHLIAALMGDGSIDVAGESCPPPPRFRSSAWSRSQLGPKEGLALINGTQASDRHRARRLVRGRAGVRRRARRRRAVGRCAQRARPSRSTRASPSFAASPARSASPPQSPACSTAARSSPATAAAARSRTRTASAASRR